jgi:hypothetical protein
VAHNFETGKNKIKLLMEYESVTQKVLSSIESILLWEPATVNQALANHKLATSQG